MEQRHLSLWNKIQAFPLDKPGVAIPFSGKLAASQNWSADFTSRAVAEYRKFLLLCCILENGAAPSHTVDEVWHLHLTYTSSYWMDLCRDTLGKDIHHYPSAGGDEEDLKHREWYRETLESYRSVFGVEPPSDIWPAPKQDGAALKEAIAWPGLPLPEAALKPNSGIVAGIAVLVGVPFVFIALEYGTPNPFDLAGPAFLRFFPLYGLALLLAFVLYRYQVKKWVQRAIAVCFPDDVTAFQAGHFLYGKHRAVQAGIVDLIKRNLMELTPDNHFLVKNGEYQAGSGETNPLVPAYLLEEEGSQHTYERLSENWYDRERFSHPGLVVLEQWSGQREPWLQLYFFHILFYGVGILRIGQGISTGRPVSFLVIEIVLLSIAFFTVLKPWSKKALVYGEASRLYKERLESLGSPEAQLLPQFALQGLPAINGLAEGVMLAGLFGAYETTLPQNKWSGWNGGGDAGDGSDGGGSSCSGGDSGGGSSCSGGSGCGGCSGGGGD